MRHDKAPSFFPLFFLLFFQALVPLAAFSVGPGHRFDPFGFFLRGPGRYSERFLGLERQSDPSVVGYNVNYGTSSGSYPQTLNAGSTASATVSNLAAGQTYYFVVTARNAAAQNSLVSNQVSFVTTAAPTPTPIPPTPTPSPTPKILLLLPGASYAHPFTHS